LQAPFDAYWELKLPAPTHASEQIKEVGRMVSDRGARCFFEEGARDCNVLRSLILARMEPLSG